MSDNDLQKTCTVIEARKQIHECETAIRLILSDLEAKTGLEVRDIHHERTQTLGRRSEIMSVYIDAEIGRLRLVP